MTELTDLAAKYARQLQNITDLYRTVELAQENAAREQREMDETAGLLKAMIGRERPRLLISIGFCRYVLVHNASGGFGTYAAIEIIEESK